MDEYKLPTYPVINFLVIWGAKLAILVALLPCFAALYAAFIGYSNLWIVGGLLCGLVIWLLAQSYVEVLRIMADTLMPR